MKHLAIVFLAFMLIPNLASALELGASIPTKAMKMTFENANGKKVAFADIVKRDNKGTLVIFSCNTCPYVIAWNKRLAAIANQAMKDGFGVLVLNSNAAKRDGRESLAEMTTFANKKQTKYDFPYVIDTNSYVADLFGATRTPEVFLFDATNKLVFNGPIDDSSRDAEAVKEHYLKDRLAKLKSGEEVKPSRVASVGCTIKWGSKKDPMTAQREMKDKK